MTAPTTMRLRRLDLRAVDPEGMATAHPNTTRRFFESRAIAIDVIPISGAVEVAPRLGLAEAIVDLVSTGSTLAMNGLRQIGRASCRERVFITV